jgi:uncharacterized glyoxalase superfamily protein PhnB
MAAAVGFYRLLGVDVPDIPAEWSDWEHHHRSGTVGGMDFDLDSAAFARSWNAGSSGPGVVIGFRLATRAAVDEAYGRLTGAGHRGLQPPYDAFWGARYAIVADPDGNGVGLMSPSDESMRSAPPDPSSLA